MNTLLYDVAQTSTDWGGAIWAGVATLGAGGLWLIIRRQPLAWASSVRSPRAQQALMGVITIVFLLTTMAMGAQALTAHQRCLAAGNSPEVATVEGEIRNFRPERSGLGRGSTPEHFQVADRTFFYGAGFPFETCLAHGFGEDGPLHDGVSVRVTFLGARILRIELVPLAVPLTDRSECYDTRAYPDTG